MSNDTHYTYDHTNRTYVRPGDVVSLLLPWSEVCLHMRVQDKVMKAELKCQPYCPQGRENGEESNHRPVVLDDSKSDTLCPVCGVRWKGVHAYYSVQLLRDDNTEFGGPITIGEAGMYQDAKGVYYYPPKPADETNPTAFPGAVTFADNDDEAEEESDIDASGEDVDDGCSDYWDGEKFVREERSEDDTPEPGEEDLYTEDGRVFFYLRKIAFTVPEGDSDHHCYREWCEENNYWPNVWQQNERGDYSEYNWETPASFVHEGMRHDQYEIVVESDMFPNRNANPEEHLDYAIDVAKDQAPDYRMPARWEAYTMIGDCGDGRLTVLVTRISYPDTESRVSERTSLPVKYIVNYLTKYPEETEFIGIDAAPERLNPKPMRCPVTCTGSETPHDAFRRVFVSCFGTSLEHKIVSVEKVD